MKLYLYGAGLYGQAVGGSGGGGGRGGRESAGTDTTTVSGTLSNATLFTSTHIYNHQLIYWLFVSVAMYRLNLITVDSSGKTTTRKINLRLQK